MKFLYYDLGEQQKDNWVVAHLDGSAANVILVDPPNFDRYRCGQPFVYTGGLYTRTPARLQIPRDGNWYLVIDCGGYRHHVHARNLEILGPDEVATASDADGADPGAPDGALVGANA